MSNPRRFISGEQALVFKAVEALTSSLDLSEVLRNAYGVLSPWLAADYAALCVSKAGRPNQYDWMVAQMPLEFFERYNEEMEKEDWVRRAVVARPNLVLRDSEMVSQAMLRRSLLYHRCRELGMPLEHVMAVLMNVGTDWHAGFTLYRERRRPFLEKDRIILQGLAPALANRVRECRKLSEVAQERHLIEALFRWQGKECIVLSSSNREVMRTERASMLLEKWGLAGHRGPHGMPQEVQHRLKRTMSQGACLTPEEGIWKVDGPEGSLHMTLISLPEQGGRMLWAVMLEEVPYRMPVPQKWYPFLTPAEVGVVRFVLGGYDNKTIAQFLGCKESTVKKHLEHVYAKLNVESRAMLISKASLQ